MRILLEDLGYAARQLRKGPGFTSLVVLTLALGIGANTAMFSVENGFHRPLPVRAPEQIVVLATQTKGDALGLEGIEYRFSYPALADFRKQAEAFSDLFAYNTGLGGLSAGGKASQFFYSYVTGNYFSVLGIKPAAGRFFLPGEGEKPGAEIVLVLGHSCWQKRLGGDAGVIGRRVRVDGKAATVVGVVPREFRAV
jgi:hypothetical protein